MPLCTQSKRLLRARALEVQQGGSQVLREKKNIKKSKSDELTPSHLFCMIPSLLKFITVARAPRHVCICLDMHTVTNDYPLSCNYVMLMYPTFPYNWVEKVGLLEGKDGSHLQDDAHVLLPTNSRLYCSMFYAICSIFCLLDYKKLPRNPPSLKLPTVKRSDCHQSFSESSLSNISLRVWP
ncbi:hypothetical protein YC2023_112041 [Brassica napus]